MQSRILTEWVAKEGRFGLLQCITQKADLLHSNQIRGVKTSELSSMEQPVPELVPVPVMRCPVPVLVICAFGYLHLYHVISILHM